MSDLLQTTGTTFPPSFLPSPLCLPSLTLPTTPPLTSAAPPRNSTHLTSDIRPILAATSISVDRYLCRICRIPTISLRGAWDQCTTRQTLRFIRTLLLLIFLKALTSVVEGVTSNTINRHLPS